MMINDDDFFDGPDHLRYGRISLVTFIMSFIVGLALAAIMPGFFGHGIIIGAIATGLLNIVSFLLSIKGLKLGFSISGGFTIVASFILMMGGIMILGALLSS